MPEPQNAEALALDMLKLARDTLRVNLRFLEAALCRLPFCAEPTTTLATDGQNFYYGFAHVLQCFQIEKELLTRGYLHTVLHCIFHHPFVHRYIDRPCWDLACDIAVEASIEELAFDCTASARAADQQALLRSLRAELKQLSAERVYHYLRGRHYSPERLATLREPFLFDEHALWYQLSQRPADDEAAAEPEQQPGEGAQNATGGLAASQAGEQEAAPDAREQQAEDDSAQARRLAARAQAEAGWREIAGHAQTDLETFSRRFGHETGSLLAGLRAGNQERIDYAEFLRRFAVRGEVMQVNDEEFDYIYYSYGLRLYGNLPLVEPLEYREVKRIREFVIAIDTSASVQGELVQKFIRRSAQILRQTESFFTKVDLYIIQCDSAVKDVRRISTPRQFADYLADFQIKGGGGTDFRPVFQKVARLQEQGELQDLKGLVYFTDGAGQYPGRRPAYDTAFVFVDDGSETQQAPAWAIKVVLDRTELSYL